MQLSIRLRMLGPDFSSYDNPAVWIPQLHLASELEDTQKINSGKCQEASVLLFHFFTITGSFFHQAFGYLCILHLLCNICVQSYLHYNLIYGLAHIYIFHKAF